MKNILRSFDPALYNDHFSTLAVFRSLPNLAKMYVLRLVCLSEPIPMSVINTWCNPDSFHLHKPAIEKLRELGIIKITRLSSTGVTGTQTIVISLTSSFSYSLRTSLMNFDTIAKSQHLKPSKTDKSITISQLKSHAEETWNRILGFLVNSSKVDEIPSSCINLIELLQLVNKQNNTWTIAPAGFHFLFEDTHSQLWLLISGFINTLQERNLVYNEVIVFLFRLIFLTVGQSYSRHDLTSSQNTFLTEMSHFGLCMCNETLFIPTPLSLSLSPDFRSFQSSKGYIFLESTFKIFVYSSSSIMNALLSLFTVVEYRLPNLLICRITKRSVSKAFRSSITSDQIIRFFEYSAHPLMRKQQTSGSTTKEKENNEYSPLLPSNVIDQIRIWETEKSRLIFARGILVRDFSNQSEFHNIEKSAQERSGLLYKNEKNIVVREDMKYDLHMT